ncbi:MAG: site-specific integrase, partial [Phycisphaeraceae bacterium]|nr:site-specific integrase [Phycisphaeraceae bacterium]
RLIYWFAVCTGLRQNEIRQLRVKDVFLDTTPPRVRVRAGTAKNGKEAYVPFTQDLADQLVDYWKDAELSDKAFPVTANRARCVAIFKRDLTGAGIECNDIDAGEKLDFHCLRCTAITWWFTEYDLTVKEVSELARATPSIVERYSRRFRLNSHAWLAKAPDVQHIDDRCDVPKKSRIA